MLPPEGFAPLCNCDLVGGRWIMRSAFLGIISHGHFFPAFSRIFRIISAFFQSCLPKTTYFVPEKYAVRILPCNSAESNIFRVFWLLHHNFCLFLSVKFSLSRDNIDKLSLFDEYRLFFLYDQSLPFSHKFHYWIIEKYPMFVDTIIFLFLYTKSPVSFLEVFPFLGVEVLDILQTKRGGW